MWFERGRLWPSPTRRARRWPCGARRGRAAAREWRPGGDHVDPRAKYDHDARRKARAVQVAAAAATGATDAAGDVDADRQREPPEPKPSRPAHRPDRRGPDSRPMAAGPATGLGDRPAPTDRPRQAAEARPAGQAAPAIAAFDGTEPSGRPRRRPTRAGRRGDSRGRPAHAVDGAVDRRATGQFGGGREAATGPPARDRTATRRAAPAARPRRSRSGFGDRPWRPEEAVATDRKPKGPGSRRAGSR